MFSPRTFGFSHKMSCVVCLCWRSWKGRLVGLLPAPLGIREHEVNNENKDADEDTPGTLLMLFECWVSLKQPLALHLWACPWLLSFTVFTFYWGVVSWMRWAEAVDWKPAETSIDLGNPVEGRCSPIIIIIFVLILMIILWVPQYQPFSPKKMGLFHEQIICLE